MRIKSRSMGGTANADSARTLGGRRAYPLSVSRCIYVDYPGSKRLHSLEALDRVCNIYHMGTERL